MNSNVSLDDLLNEASGDTPAPDANTTTTETPPATEPQTPPEGDQPQTPPEDGTQTNDDKPQEGDQQTPPENKKNPMKEVRDKLNAEQKAREKVEKAMQRYAEGNYKFSIRDYKNEEGKVDYDAFIAAMDEQDTADKAQQRGITPEVQAELDRIEKEKIELQKERLKVAMDRAVSNLQIDMNLDKNAVNKFFADALAVQKNPYQWLAQGGALSDLYYLIYRDSIQKAAIDKAVADAKAEWERVNSVKAPTSNPAAPKNDNGAKLDGVSMQDLLNEAASKK